jgi:hypothetical protein
MLSLPALAVALVMAGATPPGTCSQPTEDYEGWSIGSLDVTSPFDFVPAVKSLLRRLETQLPLQQKDRFNDQKYHAGPEFITKAVKANFPFQAAMFRIVVVKDRLDNCQDAAKKLDVHYSVYTAFMPPMSSGSLERTKEEVERPSSTAGSSSVDGKFSVLPNFAYDHTRHGYGGMRVESTAPFGIFDKFKADSKASANSFLGSASLSGNTVSASKYMSELNWQFASSYQDIPAGGQQLKEATLAASFYGSTKELTASKLVLHYAAALAGGHQQDTLSNAHGSPYGDLKFLTDVQKRWDMSAFAAGYGLQLGTTLGQQTVDFTKHILDFRFNSVFLPMPKFLRDNLCTAGSTCDDRSTFVGVTHKPFSLEARVAAGLIQKSGDVPAAERFYGGNQPNTPFIPNQPWEFTDQAYIRSIPDNKIGGGTRFYSLNLTVAKAVAGKAVLPRQLGMTDFVPKLDGAVKTAIGEMSDRYFGNDPVVQNIDGEVRALGTEVAQLKLPDVRMFDSTTGNRVAPLLKSATLATNIVASVVDSITKQGKRTNVNALIHNTIPQLDTKLSGLVNILSAGYPDIAKSIADQQKSIDMALKNLTDAWRGNSATLSKGPIQQARDRADSRAAADMKPVSKALNAVLYQLNGYSVAPVGIFDVARVWPTGVGVRYAVGGGVRLSILNANFTLGYAANANRKSGEGAGALFGQVDITGIFN